MRFILLSLLIVAFSAVYAAESKYVIGIKPPASDDMVARVKELVAEQHGVIDATLTLGGVTLVVIMPDEAVTTLATSADVEYIEKDKEVNILDDFTAPVRQS
ncbi:hypothetical protein BDB01DRAFT_783836 [Pilobolus umbonatus]|nr:hypothetical protein BDB01DRAFT_783836 [Pilobolus umbonatus]